MIDVRIVCSHDAVKLAEMLMRLLEAEEHRVRLTYGRQALHELENARNTQDSVLLIWSPDARSQTYMREWARAIAPTRLIEIARGTSDWPTIKRLAGVIDFTQWRGERGARSWKALNERLNAIARAFEPPKPITTKTLLAAGMATAAAAAAAVVVSPRMTTPVDEGVMPVPLEEVAITDATLGVGGPLDAIEPASLEEDVLRLRPYPKLDPIDPDPTAPLAHVAEYEEVELRDPTLLERLDALIPLRLQGDG